MRVHHYSVRSVVRSDALVCGCWRC